MELFSLVFEQPGLVKGVPVLDKGLGLGDLPGPSQPQPFLDSHSLEM